MSTTIEPQTAERGERAPRRFEWVWPAGFHPGRAYLIVIAISTLIVSRWFRRTFIATGDMGLFIRQGLGAGVLWSWNQQITGAGSAAHDRTGTGVLPDLAQRRPGLRRNRPRNGCSTPSSTVYSPSAWPTAGAIVRANGDRVGRDVRGHERLLPDADPQPVEHHLGGHAGPAHRNRAASCARQNRSHPDRRLRVHADRLSGLQPAHVRGGGVLGQRLALVLVWMLYGWRAFLRLLKWDAMAIPRVIALNLWWILPFLCRPTGGGSGVERRLHRPHQLDLGADQQSDPQCLDADRQLGLVPAPVPAVHRSPWTDPPGSGSDT